MNQLGTFANNILSTINKGTGGQPPPSPFQQIDPSKHQLNTGYLNQMRSIARGGNDPILNYQIQQDQLRQASDLDALRNTGASNLATQQGQMAMRGGLTSGATERLGSQNLLGQLQGQQELSRSSAAREAGLRLGSAERQMDMLKSLGPEERAASQYGFDIENTAIGQGNQDKAAQMLADAIRGQGGGGGGGLDLGGGLGDFHNAFNGFTSATGLQGPKSIPFSANPNNVLGGMQFRPFNTGASGSGSGGFNVAKMLGG